MIASQITLSIWVFLLLLLISGWAVLDRIFIPSVRWFLRRRINRVIDEIGHRLDIEIKPFQLTKRQILIDRLVYDAKVIAAIQRYAQAHGANLTGWAFLTGTPTEIQQVARQYGIYVKKTPRGAVDHTFLTSLIDPRGTLRVQYLGVRFNPDELLRDLQALVREETPS